MLLTSAEIITKSWDDYLKNWHKWAIFSLLAFLPSFVLILSGSFGGFLNTYVPSTTLVTNLLIVALVILSMVFGFWTSIALAHAGFRFLQTGKSDTWKEHYAATLPVLWPAIYTSILVVLMVFFGTIFFVVPGILFSVWYFFVIYEILSDSSLGLGALAASKKLVRGRWWSVAWRILAPSFVFATGLMLLKSMLVYIVDLMPLSILSVAILENVVTGICSALAAPLSTLAALHLFNSLKDNPFREAPVLLSSEPPTEG